MAEMEKIGFNRRWVGQYGPVYPLFNFMEKTNTEMIFHF